MMMAIKPSYLTFTANTGGSTIELVAVGSVPTISLEYSTDGTTWQSYTIGDTITLAAVNDFVMFRGNNTTMATSTSNYHKFVMSGSIATSGDITSLINGVGGIAALQSYSFCNLFRSCAAMTTIPNIGIGDLSFYCYNQTFVFCTGLTSIVINNCSLGYFSLFQSFYGCTNLVSAEILSTKSNSSTPMQAIFQNCNSLNYVKLGLTDYPSDISFLTWLVGVAASGSLYCDNGLTLPNSSSGLPLGWTRYNLDGTPY